MKTTTRLTDLPTAATQRFLDAVVETFDVGARWLEYPSGAQFILIQSGQSTPVAIDASAPDALHRVALTCQSYRY